MHDPLVVAFEIRRPWPKRTTFKGAFWRLAGRSYYWPSMITVWHVEPGGRDAGEICKHYRKDQQPDGTWKMTILHGWKLHVHHWRVQIHPLQALRRRILTRCAWCHGRSTKRDCVNTSHQWDGPRGRWWQGEPGLYHSRCSLVASEAKMCACDQPFKDADRADLDHGQCQQCGLRFGWQTNLPWKIEQRRILRVVPAGEAPTPEVYEAACAVYQRHQAAEEATQ